MNLDGYKPNWTAECEQCGESPCVDVVRKGRIAHQSNLCGVHFFNDRLMVYPEEWNLREESAE